MREEHQPTCWIIAGPNGAGKTTFALEYLPRTAGCEVFVNADLIAAGLAPLAPEGRTTAASRVFLREITQNILARRDFGFETTLAGLAYRRLIKRLKSEGWRVEYVLLADQTICYWNAEKDPVVIFTQRGRRRQVAEPALLRMLEQRRRHGPSG